MVVLDDLPFLGGHNLRGIESEVGESVFFELGAAMAIRDHEKARNRRFRQGRAWKQEDLEF